MFCILNFSVGFLDLFVKGLGQKRFILNNLEIYCRSFYFNRLY